jgi:hypothetical protein
MVSSRVNLAAQHCPDRLSTPCLTISFEIRSLRHGDVSGYLFNLLRKRDSEDQTPPAQNGQPQADHTNGDHTRHPEEKSH